MALIALNITDSNSVIALDITDSNSVIALVITDEQLIDVNALVDADGQYFADADGEQLITD